MNVPMKVNPQLPAIFQRGAEEASREFTDGVVSGFPVISYRGRTWRVKKGGEEKAYLNDQDEAVQSIEVVLVKANPKLGKIYYEKKYEEGDTSPPRCWSADGVKPDISVQNAISKTCAACPMNVWGSRITDNGKKTRACADHRRMAVAFRHDIEQAAEDPKHEPTVLLLRTPPASLNDLKLYIEDVLKPKGIPPYAVFTKIGFNTKVSHPQLTFKGLAFLNDDQGTVVMKLREADETKRVLSEADEYNSGGTTEGGEAALPASGAGQAEDTPAPPESSKKPKAKLQPAQEEELNSGDDDIAAASPATESDEIAPPTPPKSKRKEVAASAAAPAAKPKAKKQAAPPELEPAAGEGAEPSFDEMLDSLIGTA